MMVFIFTRPFAFRIVAPLIELWNNVYIVVSFFVSLFPRILIDFLIQPWDENRRPLLVSFLVVTYSSFSGGQLFMENVHVLINILFLFSSSVPLAMVETLIRPVIM